MIIIAISRSRPLLNADDDDDDSNKHINKCMHNHFEEERNGKNEKQTNKQTCNDRTQSKWNSNIILENATEQNEN